MRARPQPDLRRLQIRHHEQQLKKAANRLAHALRLDLTKGLTEIERGECSECGRQGRRFQRILSYRDEMRPAIYYIQRDRREFCVQCLGPYLRGK